MSNTTTRSNRYSSIIEQIKTIDTGKLNDSENDDIKTEVVEEQSSKPKAAKNNSSTAELSFLQQGPSDRFTDAIDQHNRCYTNRIIQDPAVLWKNPHGEEYDDDSDCEYGWDISEDDKDEEVAYHWDNIEDETTAATGAVSRY
jgi:hypothetical protein